MREERKIVKSGNSSFIVALPINWVHKNKLGKGSTVLIGENEAGDIVISKTDKRDSGDASKEISTEGKSEEKLTFDIFNAYLQSYQDIHIQGKDIPLQSSKIKNILRSCIGLEIIEQDKKSMIVKNFTTNDQGLSPRILIRKITLGIGEMFTLLSKFIKEGFSQEDINELHELVEQNSRLYWITRKIILRAIEDPVYLRIFQTTYHQITKDKIITTSLNQMIFSLNSLGNLMLFLEHTKEDSAKLKEILDSVRKDYESLLTNLRYKNQSTLGDIYERCVKNISQIKLLSRETKNYFIIESSIHLSILAELIKQITLEIAE